MKNHLHILVFLKLIKIELVLGLLVLVFFINCKTSDSIDLKGTWIFYNIDSIYNEIYINDSQIVHISELEILNSPIYNYKYENDSLYFIYENEIQGEIKIDIVSNDSILTNYIKEKVYWYKIDSTALLLELYNDKNLNFDEFYESFFKRAETRWNKIYPNTPYRKAYFRLNDYNGLPLPTQMLED